MPVTNVKTMPCRVCNRPVKLSGSWTKKAEGEPARTGRVYYCSSCRKYTGVVMEGA